ncbi:MAG TPA: sigma-70 family RNA polymerase sigma factor [Planctomycetota bacterium]|nr:sigma-70 family RNA polymerase sigma factor [Planctomycetota bacterium]
MDSPPPPALARARAGDRAAIEELLARYLPALRGFLRVQAGADLRARESSSDLAQSVCREVLQDLADFEWRGEPEFRHWLFKRAYHKLLHRRAHWQAQRRDVGREVALAASDEALLSAYRSLATPSAELMAREAVERIEAALDQLPETWRTAIVLHKLVGLSHAEIAAETGHSEGAVRNHLYRGLARLGALLGA